MTKLGHLLDESVRGVFMIAATPFTDQGALDLKSLERLIGFYVESGVHGITLLGMMGEAQKLTPEESRLVIQRTLQQVAGELPVVVGVSNPGPRQRRGADRRCHVARRRRGHGGAALGPRQRRADRRLPAPAVQDDRRGGADRAAGLSAGDRRASVGAAAQPAGRRSAPDQGAQARGLPGSRQDHPGSGRAPSATTAAGSPSWSATAPCTTRSSWRAAPMAR